METVTFVTSNPKKAEYIGKYLNIPVTHHALELDELQSLSLHTIVEHKVRQAYEQLRRPVIVEDVALSFDALGGLPGPFIKFFLEQMTYEQLCALPGLNTRGATASCVMGFYDGNAIQIFKGEMRGEIAQKPAGKDGYGWDCIFIPDGYTETRASLGEDEDKKTYLQIKPIEALAAFLAEWGNAR